MEGSAAITNIKGSRWVLWKNPQDLSRSQRAALSQIATTNKPLYRGYLLKEQRREVFGLPHHCAHGYVARLAHLGPAQPPGALHPCGQDRLAQHLPDIEAALEHRLSNARVEAINTRIAHGFRSAVALVAMAILPLYLVAPDVTGPCGKHTAV
jgi:transposase